MKNFFFLCLIVAAVISTSSCKKDSFITSPNARLSLSTDTLKFDTVFTTTGSITQSFKIRNENDQRLLLSHVRLVGGNSSAFRININGIAANQLNDIAIAANDSIYVFVAVTVNPSAANLPFILRDSIGISYNGNERFLQLEAFGQNANFLRAQSLTTNTSFSNSLPYVILDYLQVAPGATLTVQPGTRIYMHADAPLIVDGSLRVNGTASSPVIFTGDRLDEPYKNFPASWPGIFFRQSSSGNVLQFAEINNAYQAVVAVENSGASPKLTLQQCKITNAYNAGVYALNTSIAASNLLISNCGNNIFLEGGGQYDFTHCTVASFSSNYLSHKTPVLFVSNAAGEPQVINALQAKFTNCIFWGDNGFVDDEVIVQKKTGSAAYSVVLDHCLYRAKTDPAAATLTLPIKNQDPLFDSIDVSKRYFDFRTNNNLAPGVNKGVATGITKDLEDKPRPVGLPDLGCYEKQ